MSATKVRRGRFAGDNYTTLHNGVFRGGWLRPVEIAVLGHMASHVDGWETSQARIAKSMGIGLNSVKSAIQGLKRAGCVIQGQDSGDGGRFGASWYYVTDRPAELMALGVTDGETIRAAIQRDLDEWLAQRAGASASVVSIVEEAG